jgi:alpha-L-arabinofuranosidase/regulation of enolase protein 1 (concanavalin A-like superfamily)
MTLLSAPSRSRLVLVAVLLALCGALLPAVAHGSAPALAATAGGPVTWSDDFSGATLDPRWQVVNPEPDKLTVNGGAVHLEGQPGDTYQGVNSAKNVVMVDLPAGDFTATATFSAPVTKVYQGAGLIAWKDIDNYVRSGLTFVGGLSPSGVAIENDVETGASFSAVKFTDRPGSNGETIRMQRVGDVISTSVYDAGTATWLPAGSTTVSFDTTQVGLYALAAQDGTVLPAAFDSFTLEHAQGVDLTPTGTFVLQATGALPFLVADGTALRLTADQPVASLRLHAADAGDGALDISTDAGPLVLTGGILGVGAAGDAPTPLRITDAGGGKVVLRVASDDAAYLTPGDAGTLVVGTEADAVRFELSDVDDSISTLDIDGDGAGASISDTMFGIFYEDINYAADGGLYAELVRNRSFEFNSSDRSGWNGFTGWQVLDRSGLGTTGVVVDDDTRLNPSNRNHLVLTAKAAGDGIRNVGFNNGFAMKSGATYDGYLWARSTTAQDLTVRIENAAGTDTIAAATVPVDGSDVWKKYPFTFTATQTTDAGRLVVLAGAASVVGLDMVSVMPDDRWVGPVNGKSVLRKDLADKIASMKPSFLRFPGGCVTNVGTFRTYAESGYTDRRRTYQWKETVGPVEERPTNWNFWGYNQSYGIGYLEYLEFAEDLGAEPLPVLSVGANGCGSTIPEMHDQAMIDRWVDDTVDLIEFANGGTDTEWGARRAALGHPKPFGLKMIGLGNEENTTTFEANFPQFRDAIKAKYPDIKIVSNSGPAPSGSRFDTLWSFNRQQKVDLVDEHYYMDPSWFLANTHRYDSYDRTGPKVFLGEYASRGNTMGNALSEASYMTALQRNADVVRMASYAPLLANEANVQWSPDAIWFDNDESWESPNWKVQKMFGNNVGDEVVPSTFDGAVNQPDDITGGVFLSTWSTAAAYDNVKVTSNADGSTLFSDQFADASQWSPQSGTWAVDGSGRYAQSSTSVNDARSIVNGAYSKDWSNYTLELDATKLSGAEGFLIGFGATGTNNFYWWNLGGWNNTRMALQRAAGGGASEVKAVENTSINTGQTYHVKVVVEGHSISMYLDGVLQMTYDESAASEKLFQVVTRDAATGDIVAKVVNNATKPVRTQVEVSDAQVEPTGTVTQLAAAPSATNTKANPDNVAPVVRQVSGLSSSFQYEFPASSVTFLRMHTHDGVAPVVSEVSVTGTEANGWYADPATVHVEATDDRSVDHLEVQVDGGAWQTIAGAKGDVQVAGDGLHNVSVRAVDATGNVGEIRPLVVGIDKTPPVSQASFDDSTRVLTLVSADSGSGVERVEYRLDGGDWATYQQPVALGDAATLVEYRGVDWLGNVEPPGRLQVPEAGVHLLPSVTAATPVAASFKLGPAADVKVRVGGSAGTPTGTVTALDGTNVLVRAKLVNGAAVLKVPTKALGIGSHPLVVSYSGDATYDTSSDEVDILVVKK